MIAIGVSTYNNIVSVVLFHDYGNENDSRLRMIIIKYGIGGGVQSQRIHRPQKVERALWAPQSGIAGSIEPGRYSAMAFWESR